MQGHAYIVSDETRIIRIDSSAADGFEDVAPDGKEVGEIVVRGNMVMKGEDCFLIFRRKWERSRFADDDVLSFDVHPEYLNDPEATAKAFDGGWFHTGDLAVREPHGAISIQDRSKDIIISGTLYNFSPMYIVPN